MKIPFVDLKAQYGEIKKSTGLSFQRLLKRGDFILGEDVGDFEKSFARYIGTKFALGVNSGTDALFFGLLILGIGPGDEVIVPAYTYIASAFAVSYTGAVPVFVDIDERTFNIDCGKIEEKITRRTKAIMPVHLYGQPADMDEIRRIARRHGLNIIEDAAQAHGALYYEGRGTKDGGRGKKVGSMGDIGCFSFYPTKNLGAFGDGGMIVTNNPKIFERVKKLRDYGRKSRYEHVSLGYNSRLDSMQAVFLNEKLKKLDEWNKKRIEAARYYKRLLADAPTIILPSEAAYSRHVYHIFAVRVQNRDVVIKKLRDAGIEALIHYPLPLHLQKVYKKLGYRRGDCPVAEKVSGEVISLPIYPHIKKNKIEYVAKILKEIVGNG